MDEFLIWDDGIHTFAEAMEDKAPSGGFVPYDYIIKCDEYLKGALNGKYPSFKNIGLKDINGKSIYADCSIVEFEYSVGLWEYKKAIGVFFWDAANLKYRLNIIENNNAYGKVIWNFEPKENRNFKIIDTIQENKLGLIKA